MMLCFRSRACSRFYVRTSAIDMYFAFLEEVIDELRGDIFQGIYIYISNWYAARLDPSTLYARPISIVPR